MKAFGVKSILTIVVGVILAGLAMKFAADADIPLLKDARDGFDS